jgi:putative Ca2+/H+ antiporter (TMEM165/GDT1 family)
MSEAFVVSCGIVALAEIGDKTQLLSLILAARYRKPVAVVLGVLTATLANHALAGGLGAWLSHVLSPGLLNWAVVASFVLMAGWVLVPDRLDPSAAPVPARPMGVYGTTAAAFFIAEIGDKTQIATVALAARFHAFYPVVAGTTLGMLIANAPVIYLGHRFADRLPAKALHVLACLLFAVLAALALRNALAGESVAGLPGSVAAAAAAQAGNPLPLARVADVALPGDTSRYDYESLDPDRHLLFVAHLGASEVLVFDTRTRQIVKRIDGLRHVHGVLAIPELGRVYASATGTDEVAAIDEERLQIVARAPGGTYPDGMAYAPEQGKLYVSDETGATETVIDVRSNRRIATIPLGGEAGNTQYDPVSGRILVNVQTRAQLVEIDPAADRVVARTDLPGAKGNHGLLIVSEARLAFIACEDNDRLLVLDLASRRIVAAFPTGSEPDVLAYDPGPGLVYVASESGTLSVFRYGAGRVDKLAEARLAPDAHVVAVDAATHLVYLPIRNLDGRAVLRIMRPSGG